MCSYRLLSDLLESDAIGGRRVFRLLLPEDRRGAVPLLILLHGVHGSETDWTDKGNLTAVITDMTMSGRMSPMAVLMPSDGLTGLGTGYLNWAEGGSHRYETYLLDELLPEVERRYEVGGTRRLRSISGLSMGGFAALGIGLRFPGRVAAASSLSGFFDARELAPLVGDETFNRMFGGSEEAMDRVSPLCMELRSPGGYPTLAFDCGEDDSYAGMNRELHRRLDSADIPHTYREYKGAHTWDYWSGRIGEHLALHDRVFRQVGS
ncbi:alpha/beta hydrolase [Paenibacillaceae bacterium WGS1546]|uniref:alpha/beta hydrolase n=1 Tax=Cohnella sp. WGS1546 TaxID=3366810 RepID=UPI00372D37D1